ncbi:MAG: hypothetical protein OQL06_05465 [Gammaproteobacteria bacterium]|nr:hypothetical protein [Gammaproteobacteria bacterium]
MKLNESEKPLLLGIILSLFTGFILFVITDKVPSSWQRVSLPDLSNQPVKINVVHAINPRFQSLNETQYLGVLKHTQRLVKQHLNIDVEFNRVENISIETLFSYLPEHVIRAREKLIIQLNQVTEADVNDMWHSIYTSLEPFRNNPDAVIDYAQPYLINTLPVNNLEELTDRLVETLIVRGQYWYNYKVEDGKPVVDGSPYNEWVWWDSLGYGHLPYQLVITNQLVVSAERYGMATHSSLRGGITAGTTSYSKDSSNKAYIFASTFQLINNAPMLTRLRDDAAYSEQQIIEYTAALITHELGHMFYHYAHPFNKKACIMNPTPLLKYRQWVEGLDADKCQMLALPAMQPGAAKIDFNPDW